MHPIQSTRRTLAWVLALAAGLTGTAAIAQQPPPKTVPTPAKLDARTGTVVVKVGAVSRFNPAELDPSLKGLLPKRVTIERIDVLGYTLDPDLPGGLILTGLQTGATTVTLEYDGRPNRVFQVIVQPDYAFLQDLIRRSAPTANVEVIPAQNNVVILSGYVTTPQEANIIERLANSQVGGTAGNVINAMQIGGVQQVQIDVVVASVDRNELRSRGFDFFLNNRTIQFNSVISGLIGPQPLGLAASTTVTPSPDANLQFAVVPGQFFGALRALRTEGLAKFLAEPRVVTQSGRQAEFLAGGRQAVLSAASGINGPGVTFETVGISLSVLPIVYGNGQIWLEVSPTNRQVNQGFGITTVFGAVPGFTEQSIRSAVVLESGQTFAIGGLIQNSVTATNSKIPVLGDMPYVGTLFSRINYQESESELVILVTPRLVHPMDCAQAPKRLPGRETRSPDDYELFLENVLEAPRGQRKVWNGKHYNAPYKSDPTYGTYPGIGNLSVGGPINGGDWTPSGHGIPGAMPVMSGTVHPAYPPIPGAGSNPPPIPVLPQSSSGSGTSSPPKTLPAAVVPGMPVTGNTDPVAAPLPAVPVVVPPVGETP